MNGFDSGSRIHCPKGRCRLLDQRQEIKAEIWARDVINEAKENYTRWMSRTGLTLLPNHDCFAPMQASHTVDQLL